MANKRRGRRIETPSASFAEAPATRSPRPRSADLSASSQTGVNPATEAAGAEGYLSPRQDSRKGLPVPQTGNPAWGAGNPYHDTAQAGRKQNDAGIPVDGVEGRVRIDPARGPTEADIKKFMDIARQLEHELCSIVVGQERVIRELLLSLLAGGHVLLEGVPGLGKTLLVRTLADALTLKFSRIQFTPDLMPADIVGTTIVSEQLTSNASGGSRIFSFQPGPIFANIVLADEVNRATPKTQSALLEGMQERTVSVGDTTRLLPRPFFVLATQNPLEMEGTYPLPEAQLDRFLLKILVRFPQAKDLMRIIDTTLGPQTLMANQVASGEQLLHLIETARSVPVATHVKEYAVRLLLATHPDSEDAPEQVQKYVRYGASPRGLQALIMTGKVRALLEGRFNVSLEDLREVAFPALRHRIILNFDGLADGVTAEDLIETIIEETSTS